MHWFIVWLGPGHNYMHLGQARTAKLLIEAGIRT